MLQARREAPPKPEGAEHPRKQILDPVTIQGDTVVRNVRDNFEHDARQPGAPPVLEYEYHNLLERIMRSLDPGPLPREQTPV